MQPQGYLHWHRLPALSSVSGDCHRHARRPWRSILLLVYSLLLSGGPLGSGVLHRICWVQSRRVGGGGRGGRLECRHTRRRLGAIRLCSCGSSSGSKVLLPLQLHPLQFLHPLQLLQLQCIWCSGQASDGGGNGRAGGRSWRWASCQQRRSWLHILLALLALLHLPLRLHCWLQRRGCIMADLCRRCLPLLGVGGCIVSHQKRLQST